MKMKNMITTLAIIFLVLFCISCVSAAQDDNTLNIDDNDKPLEIENEVEVPTDSSTNSSTDDNSEKTTTNTNTVKKETKIEKITPDVYCAQNFIHKKSNTFKVKLSSYNEKTNKHTYYKNVKLIVKVKIGKKTKTYNVITNKKGEAKVLNVKKLKIGTYKVTVTTKDKKYNIKSKGSISIYGKAKRTAIAKLKKTPYGSEAHKKLKNGDIFWTFYEAKNYQDDKGVYAYAYPSKNPLDGIPHSMIVKAKFFFKNKKTGKVISKTSKLSKDKFYGWKTFKVNPIKGYTPIKTKIWYLTR